MQWPLWFHLLWQNLKSAVTSAPRPLYRGIDVSEFNGKVDFQDLRDRGKIDFAILRCGYGSDYGFQDDACFADNVKACQQAKLPYGVYLFMYAKNKDMALSEAHHVLRLVKGTDPAFGVWYDVEGSDRAHGDTLVTVCKTWCDAVLSGGITCAGIYASLDVMENELNSPQLAEYEKWVAQWDSICQYKNPGIWQFTSSGKIDGKTFDFDYAYLDYPEITGANMTQDTFNKMLNTWLVSQKEKTVDDWAKDSWEKACRKNLFDGTGPCSFLTREQAAVLLGRLNQLDKQ